MIQRCVGLLMLACIGTLACAGSVSAREEKQGSQSEGPEEVLLVVVFDPTVLELDEKEEFSSRLVGVSKAIAKSFSRGGRVVVFEVDRDMIYAHPTLDFEVELKNSPDRAAILKRDLLELQEKLGESLLRAWERAHSGDEARQLNSCILSALHRVGEYRESISKPVSARLVVLSDLLEACDDGGQVINFESRLPESWASDEAPRLEGYESFTVIQFANAHLRTRQEDQRLRQLWRGILDRGGVSYHVYRDLPESF